MYLLNFLGDDEDDAIRAAFGANYERLVTVKTRYNPRTSSASTTTSSHSRRRSQGRRMWSPSRVSGVCCPPEATRAAPAAGYRSDPIRAARTSPRPGRSRGCTAALDAERLGIVVGDEDLSSRDAERSGALRASRPSAAASRPSPLGWPGCRSRFRPSPSASPTPGWYNPSRTALDVAPHWRP